MNFGYESCVYPLCNIDHLNGRTTFSALEQLAPCNLFLDMGDQLKRYIHNALLEKLRAGKSAKDTLAAAGDLKQLEQYKRKMRKLLREKIGYPPLSREPPRAVCTGRLAQDGYQVEKVVLTTRPHVYVTGNLYVPDGLSAKTGAVLFLCGHAADGKGYAEYQFVCRLLAKAGLIVLAMDSYGLGERLGYINPITGNQDVEWGCAEHDYAGAQILMTGDSAARYFVHDAMRAIDYLQALPQVDSNHIGVTGNSGGGTLTALLMMLDDRIAAAAPGTFLTSLENIFRYGVPQDAEQVWKGMVNYGFDHDDVLIAMAPKPVLILSALYDYFPISGTQEIYSSAKRFYKMYGKENNLLLYADSTEHCFSRRLAIAAARFFAMQFLEKDFPAECVPSRTVPAAELACTAAGQVRCEYPDAKFMYEENVRRLEGIIKKRNSLSEDDLRSDAIAWLKKRIYQQRSHPAPFLRRFGRIVVEDTAAECFVFEYAPECTANALYFSALENFGKSSMPLTIAVWEDGTTNLQRHRDFIVTRCRNGEAVLVLDLPGYGAMTSNRVLRMGDREFEGTNYTLNNDLLWIDDSLFAVRIFELLGAFRMLARELGIKANRIALYGEGFPAVYVATACLLHNCTFRGCTLNDYPADMESMVRDRLYNSYDIFSRLLPGALLYFDFSHLKKWVEDKLK